MIYNKINSWKIYGISPEHVEHNIIKKKATHNKKIDAFKWCDQWCNNYKKFNFDSNKIKLPGNNIGYLFGNRVVKIYYQIGIKCNSNGGRLSLGIVNASYKDKESLGS